MMWWCGTEHMLREASSIFHFLRHRCHLKHFSFTVSFNWGYRIVWRAEKISESMYSFILERRNPSFLFRYNFFKK